MLNDKDDTWYGPEMVGFEGYHAYVRDVPDRFETESDDKLMESLYKNYATEGMTNHLPNHHFWVEKKHAMQAAMEVAVNNLGLDKEKAKSYVDSQFADVWKRYDVNEEGKVDLDRMPALLRSFCGNNEACIGL